MERFLREYKPVNRFKTVFLQYLILYLIAFLGLSTHFDGLLGNYLYWLSLIYLIILIIGTLIMIGGQINYYYCTPVIRIYKNKIELIYPLYAFKPFIINRNIVKEVIDKKIITTNVLGIKFRNLRQIKFYYPIKNNLKYNVISNLINYIILKLNKVPIKLKSFFSDDIKLRQDGDFKIMEYNDKKHDFHIWFNQSFYADKNAIARYVLPLELSSAEFVYGIKEALGYSEKKQINKIQGDLANKVVLKKRIRFLVIMFLIGMIMAFLIGYFSKTK